MYMFFKKDQYKRYKGKSATSKLLPQNKNQVKRGYILQKETQKFNFAVHQIALGLGNKGT